MLDVKTGWLIYEGLNGVPQKPLISKVLAQKNANL